MNMDSEEINVCDISDDLTPFIEEISDGRFEPNFDDFSEEINVCDLNDDLTPCAETTDESLHPKMLYRPPKEKSDVKRIYGKDSESKINVNNQGLEDCLEYFRPRSTVYEDLSLNVSPQKTERKSKKTGPRKDKLQVRIARKHADGDSDTISDSIDSDPDALIIKRRGRPKKLGKTNQVSKKLHSEIQRGHRDRRNRSIDIMRRVVPGVSEKLDTAGVLENSINYVLYLHKQLDVETISEEFRFNEANRKLEFNA